MIEVEVKAKIKDFESIRLKILEIGAIKIKDEFQEDIYFNSPIKDFAKTDEALRIRKVIISNSNVSNDMVVNNPNNTNTTNNSNHNLNTNNNNNNNNNDNNNNPNNNSNHNNIESKCDNITEFDNIFITYKGPKIDKNSKTRKEIEVGIEDSEKVSDIFEELGFSPVAKVIKNREIFKINNIGDDINRDNSFIISLDDIKGLGPYMEIETELEDGEEFQIALDNIFNLYKVLGIINGFERTSYLELLENKDNNKISNITSKN
ncbi:MAG: class IV adenylate cyclase [Methanobacteriaceae archaeon]